MNTTKLHINSGIAGLKSGVSSLLSASLHHLLLLINMNEQKVARLKVNDSDWP